MTTTTVASAESKSVLVRVGGSLGIAAVFVALGTFLMACFGFDAVLMLSPIPVLLSSVGMVLSVVGGVIGRHDGEAETQPIAAMFVCLAGLIGGALEMAVWLGMK
jgi:hypothetical protein